MAKKKSVGHPRNFKDGKHLLSVWDKYKELVLSKPFIEEVLTVKGEVQKIKKPQPLLRQGFEAYCIRQGFGRVGQYLDNQDGLYGEYIESVSCIRFEWQEDQFSGALTGKYKSASLIGSLNSVAQNINQNTTHKVEIEGISTDELHEGLDNE